MILPVPAVFATGTAVDPAAAALRDHLVLAGWVALFLLTVLAGSFVVLALQRGDPDSPLRRHPWLPWGSAALAAAALVVVFLDGLPVAADRWLAPADAIPLTATADQWRWEFAYPGDFTSGELHLPAGRPVALTLRSTDVAHAFRLPELGIRQDVVPGHEVTVWLRAERPDTFLLRCGEFCGAGFDTMTSLVVVHTPADYDGWVQEHANFLDRVSPEEGGARLYTMLGCNQCHSLDGSKLVGPTWRGLYGRTTTLADGATVTADSVYIRRSILEPQAQIVAGYQPVMPPFQGKVTDQGIAALIAYIKTLREEQK